MKMKTKEVIWGKEIYLIGIKEHFNNVITVYILGEKGLLKHNKILYSSVMRRPFSPCYNNIVRDVICEYKKQIEDKNALHNWVNQ